MSYYRPMSAMELTRIQDNGLTTVQASEALALEALDAIAQVHTPEDADLLLRKITAYAEAVRLAKLGREQEVRWGEVKLRAEAKMGELLPVTRSDSTALRRRGADGRLTTPERTLSGQEHNQREVARKVAAVPEGVREEYFAEARENQSVPTRAGLVRRHMTISGVKFPSGGISDASELREYNTANLKAVAESLIKRATPEEAVALHKLFIHYAEKTERKLA